MPIYQIAVVFLLGIGCTFTGEPGLGGFLVALSHLLYIFKQPEFHNESFKQISKILICILPNLALIPLGFSYIDTGIRQAVTEAIPKGFACVGLAGFLYWAGYQVMNRPPDSAHGTDGVQ